MGLFRRLDADQSGNLSQQELLKTRSLMVVGDDVGASGLSPIDCGADGNGDGMVDESEWHEFCGSLYELLGRKNFVASFQRWSDTACSLVFTNTAELPDASADTSAQEAASRNIQKVYRGRKARKEVTEKKNSSSQASPKAKRKTSKSTIPANGNPAVQFPILTVAELWEVLLLDGGRVVTSLQVGDLVTLFWECKQTGLDIALAENVPMQFEEEVAPEDLSPREVAELCKLVLSKSDVTEQDARIALAPFKHTRADVVDKADFRQLDGGFNLRRFKQFLTLLSLLLRIDEDHIITHMQYQMTGCFETTDSLAALILDRCCRSNESSGVDRSSSGTMDIVSASLQKNATDMRALDKVIDLRVFERLVQNCRIVDQQGKNGITYGAIALIYKRAIKNLPKRIPERLSRSRRKSIEVAPKKKEEMFGRVEFEVLLEELNNEPVMRKLYPSPLRMMIGLLERAQRIS